MESFARIFGRDRRADAPRTAPIRSFDRIDDEGRFCVLRLTVEDRALLTAGPVELCVETPDGAHRFVPIELAAVPAEEHFADFLVPSLLIGDDRSFVLQVGDARTPLPVPGAATPGPGGPPPTTTLQAQLAQEEQLADHARRLAELRAELRAERDKAARAEEELAEATERFGTALRGQRGEVHREEERVAEIDRELAAAREALEAHEVELARSREREAAALNERDALAAQLGERGEELRSAHDALEAAGRRDEQRTAELEEVRAALAEAGTRVDKRGAQLDQVREAAAKTERGLTARVAELEQTVSEL